jgi:hypothetical protein
MLFDILALGLLLLILFAVLFPGPMRAIIGAGVFVVAGLIGLFYFGNIAADIIHCKGYTRYGQCVTWTGNIEPR